MSIDDAKKTPGYLVCSSCGGYYQLKEGESPFDFDECECGGSLKYHTSIEEIYNDLEEEDEAYEYAEVEDTPFNDDTAGYTELHGAPYAGETAGYTGYPYTEPEVLDLGHDEFLRDFPEKPTDRKKRIIESLSKSIEHEEKTLREIKEGKWTLMEFVAEKRILDDVETQKKLVNELLAEEIISSEILDGIENEEKRFIPQIRERREILSELDGGSPLNNKFLKTAVTLVLLFIALCFLYLYFAIKVF